MTERREVALWRLDRQPLLTEIGGVLEEAEHLFGRSFTDLRLDYRTLVVSGRRKRGDRHD